MDKIHDILKSFSVDEIEKLKILLPLFNESQSKEIVTLRVFADEYSNFIKQNRSKSYHVSVMCAFKHLLEFFGAQNSIREIGLKETENFCSYLQQKVKNPVSQLASRGEPASSSRGEGYRVYYRTLKAAFNKAREWEYVKENYFLKIKLPKKQKLAPVFINSNQLSAISGRINNEVVRDIVEFAFYTGMRLDEIINLRWKNVGLENRLITVGDENFTTKGRKQRFIPICDEALEALTRRKTHNVNGTPSFVLPLSNGENISCFVFCKANGGKYTGDHISQSFKRVCKTAGLDNSIHFHSLRHSFASNLVQKGVPLYTIKELLGHSSISTTEIYSHLNMETLREAIKKLDSPHPSLLPKGEGVKQPQIFKINSAEKG